MGALSCFVVWLGNPRLTRSVRFLELTGPIFPGARVRMFGGCGRCAVIWAAARALAALAAVGAVVRRAGTCVGALSPRGF